MISNQTNFHHRAQAQVVSHWHGIGLYTMYVYVSAFWSTFGKKKFCIAIWGIYIVDKGAQFTYIGSILSKSL